MPDPNNIVIPEYKTIVFCIPKAANESIKYAFMSALGLKGKPSFAFQTCTKYAAHCVGVQDYFKFTFVRNPFDRLVSCWMDKTQGKVMFNAFARDHGMWHKMPFDKFVEIVAGIPDEKSNQHFRSQTHEIMIKDYMIPQFIGRFERLNKDWKYIQKRIPELPDLPHVNKSHHKPYQEYYTPGLMDKVAERYKRDLNILSYNFNG